MKNLFHYLLLLISTSLLGQPDYFYPSAKSFQPDIPTPEAFLGYPIGTHHTRHDQVIAYFRKLDELSDRMILQEIGQTYEKRIQVTAIITSPENHRQLEEIRQRHLQRKAADVHASVPLVIHLGYNVHGNEPSSTEAAMLTAYYLVANQEEETSTWLTGMVILLDPVYNPDGRDRHTHWANMHKGSPLVADGNDREHNEVWPGGRTNHYWFDLNRDWFLAVHPESRNRLKFFHHWRPYVMTDHHEMGTNSTFYFDPGKESSNNPIVPAYLYETLYPKFGEHFAKAMNRIGSQYFTKEAFDKLYPGYGSSYVNFYGGAGFLFEQASSRGHLQETGTVPLTFAFTIRNQFTASLTTVRASLAERTSLIQLRQSFYKTVAAQAKANPVKAYLVGDGADLSRTYAFINLLRQHKVDVYHLAQTTLLNGKTYEKGKVFLVPTDQENYLVVRSAFEKDITYADSIFYDASAWSLVHAFNLPFAEVRGAVARGEILSEDLVKPLSQIAPSTYAYVMEFTDYKAHQALYQLQQANVVVKVSFKPFTLSVNGKEKSFGRGTLIIPATGQTLIGKTLEEVLNQVHQSTTLEFVPVESGLSQQGIDLGSNFVQPVKPVKALMLVGAGISGYEAGEVWHLLDQRIGMPITKAELSSLSRINLNAYTTLVMVAGTYSLENSVVEKIKAWVQAGGTLITFKTASEWAIKHGLSSHKLVPADTISAVKRANFEDAAFSEGAKQIGGSIFQVDLDITHPIGFGFSDRKVSVYRNGRTFMQPAKNPYATVAQYTANPLIGGYVHKSNIGKIANSAAILVQSEGQGRVILFSDNPNFRGTWYGTNKLFLNALFFGSLISVPIPAE